MATICAKCSELITNNRKLTCKYCDKQYHLHCTTVSEERFHNTLTGTHRENWKCEKCHSEQNGKITHRKPQKVFNISTDNSYASLSVESEDEDECELSVPGEKSEQNQSCPEIRNLNCHTELLNLKEKLTSMELQLLAADQEIENLLAENCALKDILGKKDSKIKHLQSLLKSSSTSTPKSGRKKISNSNKVEHIKTPALLKTPYARPSETTQIRKKIIFNTPTQDSGESKTKNLSNELIKNTNNLNNCEIEQQHKIAGSSKFSNKDPIHTIRKICMLSSDPKNNILKTAEKYFENTLICHYLTSGGGIHQILNGIETKLEGYTLDDYCLVFIGESDFTVTQNYSSVIDHIRNKLLTVQHTNIIICLPIYKYYKNLFNKRIEAFNNLLYLDNLNNEYAYILDCNKNLEYSTYMFNDRNGHINKRALNVIFNDILDLLQRISECNSDKNKSTLHSLEFFRQ